MLESVHISRRMLIRDLVRRHPRAVELLVQHRIDPAYAHLSIELAARASGRDPEPLLAGLRSALRPASEAA
jgi:hypothetical protein